MSKWKDWKNNLGDARPWHLLDKENYVEEDVANSRYELCKACPFFIKATSQCSKCGCLMQLKTKLSNAECPVGIW
jgi:predicted ArsR family transcriptional regulator